MDHPTLVHHLRRSGLLSEEQLLRVADGFRQAQPRQVVKTLVAEGLLTRFQGRQILAGNSRGFLLGQYRILDQLGQGGMGVVYKAVHLAMNRLVAIKILKPREDPADDSYLALFKREVYAAAQLDHPNIVTVYDASRAKGVHYLVMEYVEGLDLKKFLLERGPLPLPLACELMRQVAQAIAYAHGRGLIHRDIKPSNLLVIRGPEGERAQNPAGRPRVKILDFGLARITNPDLAPPEEAVTIRARPGVVWGSIDYISPEQLEDVHAVDVRSDLYSLGCSFYFILTGQVPFPGDSPVEKVIKRATSQPEPVEQLRPEVPAALADLVRKLMAQDPAQRFQTPDELLEALEPWCDPESVALGRTVAPSNPDLQTASLRDLETADEIDLRPLLGTQPAPALGQPFAFEAPVEDACIIAREKSPYQPPHRRGRWRWLALGLGGALLLWVLILLFCLV